VGEIAVKNVFMEKNAMGIATVKVHLVKVERAFRPAATIRSYLRLWMKLVSMEVERPVPISVPMGKLASKEETVNLDDATREYVVSQRASIQLRIKTKSISIVVVTMIVQNVKQEPRVPVVAIVPVIFVWWSRVWAFVSKLPASMEKRTEILKLTEIVEVSKVVAHAVSLETNVCLTPIVNLTSVWYLLLMFVRWLQRRTKERITKKVIRTVVVR